MLKTRAEGDNANETSLKEGEGIEISTTVLFPLRECTVSIRFFHLTLPCNTIRPLSVAALILRRQRNQHCETTPHNRHKTATMKGMHMEKIQRSRALVLIVPHSGVANNNVILKVER